MKGISFKKFEINFTYSFLWRFKNFKSLVDDLQRIIEHTNQATTHAELKFRNLYTSCDHIFMDIEKVYDAWNNTSSDNRIDRNKFYWSIGTHPDRLGLAPLMHFDTPQSQRTSKDITEITCYYKSDGPIEVRSGISEETDFQIKSYTSTSIGIALECWDVLIRISDNGEGVATFKFILDLDSFYELSWDQEKTSKQAKMARELGCMPFIFSVLTLGRTEHNKSRQNSAPLSKLRVANSENKFESLYELFYKILFQTVLTKLCSRAVLNPRDINSNIESMDLHLMSPQIDPNTYHPEMWQSPYVCMFATLNNEASNLYQNKEILQPWWCNGIDTLLFGLQSVGNSEKRDSLINLNIQYKQAVLLLLRLYQWRDFLSVSNFIQGEEINLIDNLDMVPVPPELMSQSSAKYLFRDIDLVWDGRYLMLYHERSTLVMTTVQDTKSATSKDSFKTLLRQSLLRSLESVRSQWHGALVLAIVLDDLINEVGSNSSEGTQTEDSINILQRASELRFLYAKLLRDPLAIATDAAALAEVRRRAEDTYELPKLTNALRDKFAALTGLINNRTVLNNLRILKDHQT
jgi:hypothetical protein